MKENHEQQPMALEILAERMDTRFDAIDTRFTAVEETMATKADLEQFATKSDLEQFATKSDLEQLAQSVARGFADVAQNFLKLEQQIRDSFLKFNAALDRHMGNVRKETDALAERVKALEEEL